MFRRILFLILACGVSIRTAPVQVPCGSVSCLECKEDFYISNNQCLPCTKCDRSQLEATPCTKTQDRSCACAYDFYFDTHAHSCRHCTKCMPVETEIIPCGLTNRVCKRYPQGTNVPEKTTAGMVSSDPQEKTKSDPWILTLVVAIPVIVAGAVALAVFLACRRWRRLRSSDHDRSVEQASVPLKASSNTPILNARQLR